MQQYEAQILRSALRELGGDISANVSSPLAQGKVQITSFLLAHLMAREAGDHAYASVEEEVAALKRVEQEEQRILVAPSATASEYVAITSETLTPYLRSRLDLPALQVTDLRASLGGYSKQTWLITLEGAGQFDNRLVLRCDQVGSPVEAKTADEYGVIKLMHARGVPVPEPLWVDREPPFGGTCMVMRMVQGQTAYDVTGTQIGKDGRDAALGLALALGQVHSTPVDLLPLPPALLGASLREHVHRILKFYEDQWKRRRVGTSPTVSAALAWLYDNIPDQGVPALVHGDASLRNLMVHDGKPSALLDWELWHVGDHNEDLAYCRSDVEQFIDWDEFMKVYTDHGGRSFDPSAARFYGIFGALRNAVFADACVHSFVHAPIPDPKLAYGALVLGRKLIYDIATQLQQCQ
ncbi:putative Phosphotransferase family protein [Paraburkholderia sacchari]|uniref:phosphotransferase family protein n=1 Tax=Paraburkholderia sacchari TaxID=159450 RepID=UPI0039A6F94E